MSTLSHISHTSSHFSHISDNGGTLQQGRFFWMQCAIDEPVLRGCVNLSTVPMSTVMADQLDWIDMVIDAEAYEKFGDPRTCVIVGSESHDTYSVLVMATFGSRPISAIDRLTAFYAFSRQRRLGPGAPVIFLLYQQSRFLANDLKILESVCAWKEEETLNIPDDEFKAMQADWKNQQEALNRLRQTPQKAYQISSTRAPTLWSLV
ncbi:hypothetical protein AURDEDRAFT_167695 [Auricularia subglabra TFB-10046 SS5]|nr:hypothetical protein AURDEDRAFT_167695 [Auricularia subglabra TFB-10046 SS5]